MTRVQNMCQPEVLLAILFFIAAAYSETPNKEFDTCDDKFFKCASGSVACVANSTVCDGKNDCDDASDESVDAGCSIAPTPVARLSTSLEVPRQVYGVHIDGMGILLCWHVRVHARGATKFQIMTNFPDGSNKIFKFSQPGFFLKDVRPNATYSFKVRQWTSIEYSRFSNKFTVNTGPSQEDTYEPVDISVNKTNTATFSWNDTAKQLLNTNRTYPRLPCVTFEIEICLRRPIYREWATNETLISDVIILDYYNSTKNKTEDLAIKNYTIHYEKHHRALLRYENVTCNVTSSDELRFQIDGLVAHSNYSYIVRVYLGARAIGRYTEGSFTATGYVPPIRPKAAEQWYQSGIIVYGLSCGVLCFALAVGFLLAYICRWERLMSDLAVKKDKIRCEKKEEMDKRLKAKLLTESFINNQTDAPVTVEV